MIRRPPTRIELKNEDLQEFDYFQKMEKKKTPPSAQEAQKLLRQERIGYVAAAGSTPATRSQFRRMETTPSAAVAGSSGIQNTMSNGTATSTPSAASIAAATAGSDTVINPTVSDRVAEGNNGNDDDIDESLEESLVTAFGGTPDLSTNMSMDTD